MKEKLSVQGIIEYLGIRNKNEEETNKLICQYRMIDFITQDFKDKEICLEEDYFRFRNTEINDKILCKHGSLIAYIPHYKKTAIEYEDTKKCIDFIAKQFEETTNKSNVCNALDMIREIIEDLEKEYNI